MAGVNVKHNNLQEDGFDSSPGRKCAILTASIVSSFSSSMRVRRRSLRRCSRVGLRIRIPLIFAADQILHYLGMSNTSDFTIMKEDHTLGNLLSEALKQAPHVLFAAYKGAMTFLRTSRCFYLQLPNGQTSRPSKCSRGTYSSPDGRIYITLGMPSAVNVLQANSSHRTASLDRVPEGIRAPPVCSTQGEQANANGAGQRRWRRSPQRL